MHVKDGVNLRACGKASEKQKREREREREKKKKRERERKKGNVKM